MVAHSSPLVTHWWVTPGQRLRLAAMELVFSSVLSVF